MIIFRKFSQAGLKAECADVRAPHPRDVLHLESVTKCPSVTGIAAVFCCPEAVTEARARLQQLIRNATVSCRRLPTA